MRFARPCRRADGTARTPTTATKRAPRRRPATRAPSARNGARAAWLYRRKLPAVELGSAATVRELGDHVFQKRARRALADRGKHLKRARRVLSGELAHIVASPRLDHTPPDLTQRPFVAAVDSAHGLDEL